MRAGEAAHAFRLHTAGKFALYIIRAIKRTGIMPERYYTTARDVPVWTKIVQTLRLSAELPWWESKILLGKIFCTNPHCQRRVICWHLEGAQTLGIILFGLRNFVSFCINGIAYQAAHLPNETRTTEPWLRNRLADARATFCAAAQFTEHGGMGYQAADMGARLT